MKDLIEYDNMTQVGWIQEDKAIEEFKAFKASWEAWKVKNGLQDGQIPTAHQLLHRRPYHVKSIRGVRR